MGLKLAEQLKLDNTAVQKRRNWTLAQKGAGVGRWMELFFFVVPGNMSYIKGVQNR